MPKILFLTTAHHFDDDRIFYHQAKTLYAQGFQVKICSLTSDTKESREGIEIECSDILQASVAEKIQYFSAIAEDFQPQCIIASEPVAVLGAKKYCQKNLCALVYDITEWYPAMSMLKPYAAWIKPFQAIKFSAIQLFAGNNASHFIFGEKTKYFPLKFFFPFKKFLLLPYYPDLEYVKFYEKKLDPKSIVLCCTGALSKEKGIGNFFKAAHVLQKRNPEIEIKILIVGGARSEEDQVFFNDLKANSTIQNIEIRSVVSFENFTEAFTEADFCFDLRNYNFENHHSLPIKLFYYIGAGKPVFYTDLKAVRNHIPDFDFIHLQNPQNADLIAESIAKYLNNPDLYAQHSRAARNAFLAHYHWGKISSDFVAFIQKTIPQKIRR